MLKKFISIFIVPSITTITFLFAQNHSLSFDGSNDYVINSSLSGFNFSSTNEITIETWFMMESHSGYDGIVSMNADGIKYRMMVNPGMHPFYDAGMHYDVAVSDFAFSLNTWYHYALVIRGGGNAEVYVDGTLISSNPTGVPGSLPDASQILIGNGEGPGVHSSNAIIDECRIWNKALSSEEIQFYMSTSPENNESGLVGYWNFNEGEGSILSDKTSNGNDCTIYGSSWSYSIPPTLGEISDNDLLIETHDLLFTEYSLIESSQLEVGKSITLKFLGHTMCMDVAQGLMPLTNMLIATHLILTEKNGPGMERQIKSHIQVHTVLTMYTISISRELGIVRSLCFKMKEDMAIIQAHYRLKFGKGEIQIKK